MDILLRIATLGLLFAWRSYWSFTERIADREKPKTIAQPAFFSRKRIIRNIVQMVVGILLFLPLVGIKIFPMEPNQSLQLLGFFLVVLGVGTAVVARRELGTNWANAYEYQIKKKQTLITSGIYAYIRNPIYTGLILATTGAELVAGSNLFLLFLAGGSLYAYIQSKREEKILEAHFGKEYRNYKKRSKMLIPFVF
jgi:protein-S-isoprenylcysteine O-methyltransferase Ste14